MQVVWVDHENRRWFKRWFFRDAKKGIEYLTWEASLSEKEAGLSQGETAQTILDLYDWWINIRPKREDPFDLERI